MTTRKKCIACGLIAFASDEVCKRCGSDKLFEYATPEDLPSETKAASGDEMHSLNYVACFMLACIIEFISLFLFLANTGMRHSSSAPLTNSEMFSQIVIFTFHLPTSLFIWLALSIDSDAVVPLMLSAPVIQIALWTFMFTKLRRRMNRPNKLK